MKLGEKGIIKIGEGFAVRAWEGQPDDWEVITPEHKDFESTVGIKPCSRWDRKESKIVLVPGYVDVEFEHDDGYNSITSSTHEVSLEMLAEVLRRSGYEVTKS